MAKQHQPNFARSSPTPWPISKAGGWRRPRALIEPRWPSSRAIPRSRTTSAWRSRPRAVTGTPSAVSTRRCSADPGFVSAHYNRAVALMALGETQEAIKAFGRAAALEPQHYEAHRALGFLWLSQGERGRALDHFARTYELRRGDDRTAIALKSLTTAARHKLEHDAEQFLYLSQRTRRPPALRTAGAQLPRDREAGPGRGGHAVRCADRRAGRGLQHADPSARRARGRGPRRQRTGGSGRADRAVRGAGGGRRRRSAHAAGARLVAAVPAGEHDLARLLPHRRLRRVLSRRRARLSAAPADRGRTPAARFPTFSASIRCPRPGRSRACGRSRPSTFTPTMPPSASISGSRRRKPTSTRSAAAWSSAARRRPTIGRSRTTTPTRSGL